MYEKVIKLKEINIDKEKMDTFFLNFAYNSNKIENNETRLRDVESIFRGEEVDDFIGDVKTIREIENHKKVCDSMINLFKKYNSKLLYFIH